MYKLRETWKGLSDRWSIFSLCKKHYDEIDSILPETDRSPEIGANKPCSFYFGKISVQLSVVKLI